MTTRSPSINVFLADLLNNIRNDCESEFIYPKLTECLKMITDRYNAYYVANFKVSEGQLKLVAASLCLSGKESFLGRFDEIISIILLRIREKTYSDDSILIIAEMLSTYYNKYSDAWATLLERTESILAQIFPIGRKNVLACEDGDVDRIVIILGIVCKKLPRFCYNEIIKRLIKQSQQSYNNNNQLDNFPWDRANIALQTFLHLCCSNASIESGKTLVWKPEYSKVKIGDLELEQISKEISDLIHGIFSKITKQFWQGHLNQFNFDSSKTKLISFLKMILGKYLIFIDSGIVLNMTETNIPDLCEDSKIAFKNKVKSVSNEAEIAEIIHKIGNMIFGQSFKLDTFKVISNPENEKVYKFFEFSFNRNCKTIPNPPENLQENPVLRGGIFYILESLTSWSQTKLFDPTAQGKLDENEIELFGRIVDVYFKLLVQYEALVKTVYLEKQNAKNIILRSWSSMVGFKRNSKEIADFLASILGYSDERLRWRIIDSFSHLPCNRFGEFMKLFERYRLAVSEDFVNLKRNRRHEKFKIEITRLYKNVLKAWNNPQDVSNLTPLRMILRHVIEVYYYVSKNETIDEFIWTLRGEFCGLLREYLRIINSMQITTRKIFLPLKFHLEVWLTIDEWLSDTSSDINYDLFTNTYKEEIDGLFVNFSYNLIAAVSSVDNNTLPKFIDNLVLKISNITSDTNFKSQYVYNLMKSSIETDRNASEIIFFKLIEFIGSGKDFDGKFEDGIKLILEREEKNEFKGPALDLFKMIQKSDMADSLQCDLKGVLEIFHLVSDAKMQKRILTKMQKSPELIFDEKIIAILFDITTKLMETFPNSLRNIWNSTTSQSKNNLSLTIHHLQKLLQNSDEDSLVEVSKFIYESIEAQEDKENILLRYAHPFSGTKKCAKYSPLDATVRLIPFRDDNSSIKALFMLLNPDGANMQLIDANELLKWAVECPLSKISYSAWRELKRQSSNVSNVFISELLKKTKVFLQHLVCPATLNYFDPELVKEILEFFSQVIQNNDQITEETFDDIFEMILVQISARDKIVFETICTILKDLLPKISSEKIPIKLYYELSRRSSMSIDLLYALLLGSKEQDSDLIEKYFYFLVGIMPYLFRLFEESLNVIISPQIEFDYTAELEYMKLLGQLNQRVIIIDKTNLDENGILCLLELNEFLTSIAKMKKRPSIDFYKTFATILSSERSISDSITKLVFYNHEIDSNWDQFLIYYFDSMRIKASQMRDQEAIFRIANILAESSVDNCQIRQRVIDYLMNSI